MIDGVVNGRTAVVILFLFAAGCSGKKGEIRGTEVTYNCAANATDIRNLESQIPSFADSTGITIILQPFTGQEKLYAMMAARQAPDIFYTNAVVRDRLAAEGRLLDLRTVSLGDPFLHRLWPDVYQEGFAADSGLYSIGNWVFTAGVYYNREMFDEEGIAYPDTSWTWEDLKSVARRLTRGGGEGTQRYGIYIGSHFVELLEQMNGSRLPARSLFLELPEQSLAAYREYLSLMDEGLMPDLRRVEAMGMQAVQLLQSKKVAMLVEAVPHQTLIETLTMRWGIAPIPRFSSKPVRYFRSASGGLSLSAQSPHAQAAWRALKWIVAGARAYQPNPVLRDVDFIGGWEARYPVLVGSGFGEVWRWSIAHNAGDPRFFVRFSSWSSATILERLQPLLDQVWARHLEVGALEAAVPTINEAVRKELQRTLRRGDLKDGFLREIKRELEAAAHGPHR
jgi:ABC-type glycerol-3-phosphate transport system substrate-binding protein